MKPGMEKRRKSALSRSRAIMAYPTQELKKKKHIKARLEKVPKGEALSWKTAQRVLRERGQLLSKEKTYQERTGGEIVH